MHWGVSQSTNALPGFVRKDCINSSKAVLLRASNETAFSLLAEGGGGGALFVFLSWATGLFAVI